jgi:hypothetical protein
LLAHKEDALLLTNIPLFYKYRWFHQPVIYKTQSRLEPELPRLFKPRPEKFTSCYGEINGSDK